MSDHLPQFLTAPHIFSNVPNKNPVFEHDWSKYNHEEFILDYFTADWPQNNNIDVSSQNVFNLMNNVLYKYAPFKN